MSATTTTYRYRLISAEASSSMYGQCEVCGQHASEVFHQTRVRQFLLDDRDPPTVRRMHPDGIGWSHAGDLFGHEECLIGARVEQREPVPA